MDISVRAVTRPGRPARERPPVPAPAVREPSAGGPPAAAPPDRLAGMLQRSCCERAAGRPVLARAWLIEKAPVVPTGGAKERELAYGQLAMGLKVYGSSGGDAPAKLEALDALAGQVLRLRAARNLVKQERDGLGEVLTSLSREADLVRYSVQRAATTAAFATGVPRYLNISPKPGGREALATGDEGRYAPTVPLEQQFRAGAPTDPHGGLDIEITGPGGVIDLLVVSGGHGGVGALFESDSGHLQLAWWATQVERLVAANVKAKLIVLDACLTASMVPAFAPLLEDGGKIVSYVHSIPEMTMTDKVWNAVIQGAPDALAGIVDTRLAQLVEHHAKARKGTALEATVAVAIYGADRERLHYEDAALDDAVLAQLQQNERLELGRMKQAMKDQDALAHTDYVPSLAAEAGTPAVAATERTIPQGEWASWFTLLGDAVDDVDDGAEEGGLVMNFLTQEKWQVVSIDATSMVVKVPEAAAVL
jgi:hypothetical protein